MTSKNILEAIISSSSDAIISADVEGRIITWNAAAEMIFGHSAKEVDGKPLTILMPARFRDAHDAGISRVAKSGETKVIGQVLSLTGLHKDGHEFPIELTLSTWELDETRYFGGVIRDVTESAKLTEELSKSEEQMRSVMDSANDAIICAEQGGNVILWNAAAEKMLGYTAQEVMGKPLTVFIPERFRNLHEQGIKRVANGGDKHVIGKTVQLSALHKDGHELPVDLSLSTWGSNGQKFFSGIIRDVTERVKLMEDLSHSEEQMRSVMDSANDAIICAEQGGNVILWNAAAEKMLGYTAKEVMGKPLTVFIPERFRDLHEQGIARVANGGDKHVIGKTVQLSALHKDGHELPVDLSLSTWGSNGQKFFSGIIRDVTERVKLMEDLSSSEEQMRAVMDSATDGIVCADEMGNIILCNPSAEKMLGQTAKDLLGQPLTIFIPEHYRDAHSAGIDRMRNNGEAHVIGQAVELQALHSEGHEIPIELSLGTWVTGEKRYFSGIIRDTTLRKEAEAKMAVASKALDNKNQQLEALSIKLAKYLSKQVYDSIFTGKRDVKVESYRKNLTIFFSDIKGFTDMTDKMEAETLSALLNRYLSEMSHIAETYGGTVDKFIGDGIMIFFGDPETNGEKSDAVACIKMALKMRDRIHGLCQEWIGQGAADPLHVRIGVNTGYCTVGNFGSEERMDYTIVGGQVNTTARLETAAAPNQILISHSTYSLVKDQIYCQPVGEIVVKGIAHPIKTYEAISTREEYLLGANTIEESGDAFNLSVDLTALDVDGRKRAKESLKKALEALDQ